MEKTVKTDIKDWKEHAEAHYSKIYAGLDPDEIVGRCNVSYNSDKKYFSVRLMGTDYKIAFPKFEMNDLTTEGVVSDEARRVLVLRYLCEGKYQASTGKQLSYREIPWGEVYFRNFEGRCIKRVARMAGANIQAFNKIFETHKQLKAEKLSGNAAWRFEFINGLFMSIIIWEGDDEFPTSAQILFDDNFPAAFSAEDITVLGEIAITALKTLM
ncbi:hypothetical protein FACS189494_08860 [Spirochaetia bacterium]|nr:hypothetical protein FACS189494_08860 [Spirochaetia bacterium]